MSTTMKKFTKGIVLRGETSDVSENLEGSLFQNSSDARVKAYIEGAVRQIVTNSQSQVLTNKTIDAASNSLSNIANANISASAAIDASKIADGSVSNAEFQYLGSVTSDIQTQLNTKVETASNLGATGEGVFAQKTGVDLQFKKLIAGSNVILTSDANSVTIASSGGGGPATTTYPILDNQTNTLLTTLTDNTKVYDISYSVDRSVYNTEANTFNSVTNVGDAVVLGAANIFDRAVQSDGKIILVGTFKYKNQITGIVRLNSDKTEDTAFSANVINKFPAGITSLYSVKVQTDGKILIGGFFTNYGGVTNKNYLIRLNSDGTEDTAFTANAVMNGAAARFTSTIFDVEVQTDGKILIGGLFINYSGTTNKNYLIRLNSDGTEDTAFTANAVMNGAASRFGTANVDVVKLQTDGKIIIAGGFTNYNATGKNRLIRLNSDGTEDTTFSTNAVINGVTPRFNSGIQDVAIQTDGKILACGSFTNYNSLGKQFLIRLNSDGTEDTSFSANAVVSGTTSKFVDDVFSIALLSTGTIILGCWTNGVAFRSGITALNSDGTDNTTYYNNSHKNNITFPIGTYGSDSLSKVLVFPDDSILAQPDSLGLASYTSNGTPIQFFNNVKFSNSVMVMKVQSDGKLIAGGYFTTFNNTSLDYLVRLNSDGTEDTAFSANILNKFNGPITEIKLQSDGKIIIAGVFTNFGGTASKNYLIRLNSDGTEDTAFTANAVMNGAVGRFNSVVFQISVQTDGKIILGGQFINYNTTNKNYLIRLNSDGTEDTAFSTNAVLNGAAARFNNAVYAIGIQTDGKIIVGGEFTNYNATGKSKLIRLNSTGTEDTAFSTAAVVNGVTPRFNSACSAIAIQSDGKILVGGAFTNYSAQTGKNSLIRLNSTGTEDTAFSTNAVVNGTTPRLSSQLQDIEVQSDGKILIAGPFSSYSAQTGKDNVIRLNSDGTEDTAFSTSCVVNGTTSRFDGGVGYRVTSITIYQHSIFFLGFFYGYENAFSSQSTNFIVRIDQSIRTQIGKVQAVPSNAGFLFSSPVTTGPQDPTGVTMSFNTDGTIKYSSTTLNNPAYAVDDIKIRIDSF